MTTKSGIIVTCVGIIIVARYSPSTSWLPRKRILAKAKAAMLAEIMVSSVKVQVIKRLLPIVLRKGKREKTSP